MHYLGSHLGPEHRCKIRRFLAPHFGEQAARSVMIVRNGGKQGLYLLNLFVDANGRNGTGGVFVLIDGQH